MSIKIKIQENIPLDSLTTYKIGGPAKFFIEIKTKEDLIEAFHWAKENKEKIFILGGGSNILINDQGVDGLVIKVSNEEITVRGDRLDCGAGASLSQAVRLAIGNNLSGLEWAVGIPRATIGGAVRGNAGAFGSYTSGIVETVEVFNFKKKLSAPTGRFELFSNKDCNFNYRESFFKTNENYLIWQVVLKMRKCSKQEINNLVNEYLEFRNKKQPKLPSAGSIFKNLDFYELDKLNPKLADLARKENKIKNNMVGAGWIIDLAGLKGKTIGGAKVSLEQANFIINTGQATAEDIVKLINYIKQRVRDRFRVELQEELQCLGF